MDLWSESTVVVGEDVNQRNGNHRNHQHIVKDSLLDSDRSTRNTAAEGTIAVADASEVAVAPPPLTKGFGLKKWRRIRRKDQMAKEAESESEKEKDYESDSTTGRILKRGSANILNENENENGGGSMISKNRNDNIFNVGADSDKTDRSSSKSSTAASYPKLPHRSSSHRLNKNVHVPVPPNKNKNDPSKKPKAVNVDKDSSPLSSMESDSRSSFPNPQHPPPISQHQTSQDDRDPLVQSISMLQSAQLALQTEVQKFGEIGKGICSLCDDSDKTSGVPVPSLSVDPLVNMDRASDGCSEFNHAYLSKIVETLEIQLNEAESSLKKKELRIAELETTIRSMKSPQERGRSAMEELYKRCIEMEAELLDLFKQKLEAEVQFVVIARSSKAWSVLVEDQKKLLREHNSISGEQAHSPRTMVEVENKAVLLQRQAEKSDTLYSGEEVQKMQRGVVKFTNCLVIQLVLLVLVFALFVLQLVPKPEVVVPT